MEHLKLNTEQLRLFLVNAAIIFTAVVLMSVSVLSTVAKENKDKRIFASGIVVNGEDIGGLTFSEAQNVIDNACNETIQGIKLRLVSGDKVFSYTAAQLGMSANVSETLEKAFAIGKTASTDTKNLSVEKSELKTEFSVDSGILDEVLSELSQSVSVPAVNAESDFNSDTKVFTFKEGVSGVEMNVELCKKELLSRIKEKDFSDYAIPVNEVMPAITAENLEKNSVRIARFSSNTTGNLNRNTNISLMCSYINGYCIQPNAVLSINDLVGERTAKKGFLPAPAIMDGIRLQNDLGGGICQLSGTLFNAALLANLKIAERHPHSWPSDYVPVGLDSTLDWNTKKDLKLQNLSEYPVYIAAWLESENLSGSNTLVVEIYGEPLPKGVTMKVRSVITETYKPKAAIRSYSYSMPWGQVKTVTEERIGYRTEVYRDFFLNGVQVDSELVSRSYYKPIQGEVVIGRATSGGNSSPSKPSDEPTPTPIDETPAPIDETPTPSEPVESPKPTPIFLPIEP